MLLLKGVLRVTWQQSLTKNTKPCDRIPQLNITRSLGDLWSSTRDNHYLISPMQNNLYLPMGYVASNTPPGTTLADSFSQNLKDLN